MLWGWLILCLSSAKAFLNHFQRTIQTCEHVISTQQYKIQIQKSVSSSNLISNSLRHLPGIFSALQFQIKSLWPAEVVSAFPTGYTWERASAENSANSSAKSNLTFCQAGSLFGSLRLHCMPDNCSGDFTSSLMPSFCGKTWSPKGVETHHRLSSTRMRGFDPHLLQSWWLKISG